MAIVLALAGIPERSVGAPAGAMTIRSIKAWPYFPASGHIGRATDLFDPALPLRNVIIGGIGIGGDGEGDSSSTAVFVDVEVAATLPATPTAPGETVELRAQTKGGRVLQLQRVGLATHYTAGSEAWHVPFIVYGTGCEVVDLRVRILDSHVAAEERRTIRFTCGE